MKVGKDGTLKLGKNERRYGNFVVKNEEHHFKICDIHSNMTHRVSKELMIGKYLEEAWQKKASSFLEHYASMVWVFSNMIADQQFFLDMDKVMRDCVERNKGLYNIEENISEEEDAKILQEQREIHEEIEKLKEEEANEPSEE